jgi:hypothetical protein
LLLLLYKQLLILGVQVVCLLFDQCLKVVFVVQNLLKVLLDRRDHPLVVLVALLVGVVLLLKGFKLVF